MRGAWARRGRDAPEADDAGLESRLVWMLGSPRSGSTWLLQLLTHPLTPADDSELGVERRDAPDAGAPQAIPINEPYIPQHLSLPLLSDDAVDVEMASITLNEYRRSSPNYFLSERYTDAWRPGLRRLVTGRLGVQARDVAARHGLDDPLVIVKEPNGSLGARFLMSLLPRARLLFLLRDGRDVVDSMIDAQAPGGWLARRASVDFRAERLELVRRESRLWAARTRAVWRAYEEHPPELRRLVRYEEARTDPAGVLTELDRWLGFVRGEQERASAIRWNDFDSYPAEVKGSGMPLRAAQPGLWRENLSAAEQGAMRELMGTELAEFGYGD